MDRLHLLGLRTFHAICAQGTLKAAADILGVQPSAVSQQLKQFEDHIGVALFVRNTRSIALTQAGRDLLERTRHILSEAGAAIEAVRAEAGATSGPLRITLPFRAWQSVIAPRFAEFQRRFPEIELDLSIEEELIDIAATGFHAGIRLGDHLQNHMIAKALSPPMPGAYVAAPGYVSRHGLPQIPSDLLAHHCIRHRMKSSGMIAPWEFEVNGELQSVAVSGPLIFNDLRSVVDAALNGFGIGWSLKVGVQDALKAGSLVQVLAAFTPERPRFFIYFPEQLRDLPRLRAFIEHFSIGNAL